MSLGHMYTYQDFKDNMYTYQDLCHRNVYLPEETEDWQTQRRNNMET